MKLDLSEIPNDDRVLTSRRWVQMKLRECGDPVVARRTDNYIIVRFRDGSTANVPYEAIGE